VCRILVLLSSLMAIVVAAASDAVFSSDGGMALLSVERTKSPFRMQFSELFA